MGEFAYNKVRMSRKSEAVPSPYLTEREVAERLRCSARTVRAWRAAGTLPGGRLPGRSGRQGDGRLVRYRRSDVERFEARIWREEVR